MGSRPGNLKFPASAISATGATCETRGACRDLSGEATDHTWERADGETRTRGILHGKQTLYHLSYIRKERETGYDPATSGLEDRRSTK